MRIPTGNFGNVVAQPGPAANIPAGAFVDGSGEAMQRAGAQIAGIGVELAERVDMAATMEAEQRLADWQLRTLLDPKEGALNRKGKAAIGITKPTLDGFDKETQSISASLKSTRQKDAFTRLAQNRRLQIATQIAAHEAAESEAYAKGEMKGFLQTAVDAAALQFSNPQAVEQEAQRSAGALRAFALSQGWSEAQTEAAVKSQTSEIHSAVAERMIQADPRRGMEYIQKNMALFGAAEGARLQKSALSATESRLRLALAQEERAERIRLRQEKVIAKNTAMQGDVLFSQGQLTADWIEKNRDRLTPEDHRYFYNKLEGSQERTDPIIYTNLRTKLAIGEDITSDAREALQLGLLKPEDYQRLSTIQDETSVSGGVPPVYKRGVTYIQNALRVSDLNPDPAAAQRQASALNDWDDWVRANPKVSDKEAQSEYQRIVEEYAIIDMQDLPIMKRMPRYAVGDRRNINIEETARSTVQAFMEKHGGDQDAVLADPEFQRQSLLIDEWREVMRKAAEKQATQPGRGESNGRR